MLLLCWLPSAQQSGMNKDDGKQPVGIPLNRKEEKRQKKVLGYSTQWKEWHIRGPTTPWVVAFFSFNSPGGPTTTTPSSDHRPTLKSSSFNLSLIPSLLNCQFSSWRRKVKIKRRNWIEFYFRGGGGFLTTTNRSWNATIFTPLPGESNERESHTPEFTPNNRKLPLSVCPINRIATCRL